MQHFAPVASLIRCGVPVTGSHVNGAHERSVPFPSRRPRSAQPEASVRGGRPEAPLDSCRADSRGSGVLHDDTVLCATATLSRLSSPLAC